MITICYDRVDKWNINERMQDIDVHISQQLDISTCALMRFCFVTSISFGYMC